MLKSQRALRDRVPNVERLAGRERKRRRGDVVSGAAQRNDDRQMVYSPSDVLSPVGPGRTRRVRAEPRYRWRGFSLTSAGLPHWSDMDDTGTDRLHSLFCPLQIISQICWRSKPVPILLWLLGVPLSVVVVLWLVNVI